MASVVYFDNQTVIEPGSYATIKSQIPVPASIASFSTVVIIDTGSGKGYGFGSGVAGELASDQQSIYRFTSREDMQASLRGGLLYDIANYLWAPSNNGSKIEEVIYARAATTVAATKELEFVTGVSTAAGSVTIGALTEGACANGVEVSGVVTVGYGMKLRAGVLSATAFIIDFYEGQYRGADPDSGLNYEMSAATVSNNKVCQSIEFTTTNQLIAWMNSDETFKSKFFLKTSTAGDTTLSAANLTNITGMQLLAGGTTVYNTAQTDAVLESIADLDNSAFLCDNWGITPLDLTGAADGMNKGALCTDNNKILTYITTTSVYKNKTMYVGGGNTAAQYSRTGTSDGSEEIATYYNSPRVVVVHSGSRMPNGLPNSGLPYRDVNAFYTTAMVCGRILGLEPQIPGTYKDIRVIGMTHNMKNKERVRALQKGVLHIRFVPRMGWVINQAINTMQLNTTLVYPDGSSPEVQIMRIEHQMNKEMVINSTPLFVGGNQNTVSAADVKAFVESFLTGKCATREKDNLIISFSDIRVTLIGDTWDVKYCFVPNGPINKLFYTGFIIDPKANQ